MRVYVCIVCNAIAFAVAPGCIWQDVCVEGAVRVDGHCMFLRDGGVDPNAPSQPTVALDPDVPTTVDDLRRHH
jgi:hypothetical protein